MTGRALPTLKADAPLETEWRPDLLQGVVVIKGAGRRRLAVGRDSELRPQQPQRPLGGVD